MTPCITTQICALVTLLWGITAAGAATLDPGELRRLRAGEVLINVQPDPEGATGLVEAVIDIAAPPPAVWAIMLDCERAKRIIPSLKTCRVLSQTADARSDVREHIVQWFWPLPPVRSVFRAQYTPFQQIAFELVEGDLAFLKGSWTLEPLRQGEATRLSYRARISPGWPIPGPVMRSAIEADVPKTLVAVRREATRHE